MKDTYLLSYNLAQFFGWSLVFFTRRLDLLLFFQTLQLLEVLHCIIGFVRSSAIQTFMQILSRLIIVYLLYFFPLLGRPTIPSGSWGPPIDMIGVDMILIAWPIAEFTRYIYYALNLMKLNLMKEKITWSLTRSITRWSITWLPQIIWARYSFFIVLYPMGASGELLILYKLMQILRESENQFKFSLPNPLNISVYGDVMILVVMLTYVPCK